MIHAIRCQFPNDPAEKRKVLRQWGRLEGLWKIEAANIDRYKKHNVLMYEGRTLGTIDIRQEFIRTDHEGNVSRERIYNNKETSHGRNNVHGENDLLITLKEAHTDRFSSITDEMILREIVKMEVGKVKKAPQPQRWSRESDELNGNKFFVLSDVSKEDAKRIPSLFEFYDKRFGTQRMWLNHKYKVRRCFYCGEEHTQICPLKEAETRFVQEREAIKREVKIYGSSELRYSQQNCLASDIDLMSGGTTGNILNAIDVDEDNKTIKNFILIAGQAELHEDLSPEEFLLSLKRKDQRLNVMATEKSIAILQPPLQNHIDPVQKAKEVIFHEHLREMEEDLPNLKVWPNPIDKYEEDDGRHPSPEQTAQLLHYMDKKAQEDLGVTIFLPSGANDFITTRKKYGGVRSLYKYGCGACADRSRNKWWGLCTFCTECAMAPDENGLIYALQQFNKMAQEIQDRENPLLANLQDLAYGLHSSALEQSVRERSPLKDHQSSASTEPKNDATKKIKFFHESEN